MKISSKKFKDIMIKISGAIEKNVEFLTDLDSKIGDGDHGVNMAKGFRKIKKDLQGYRGDNIGQMLILSGKVLLNEIGGAMGPLYGGGFVKAGTALNGREYLDKDGIYILFSSLLNSIKELGGAEVGDKTMVDTLEPFVDKYSREIKTSEMKESFKSALTKAEEGMMSTKDMVSRVGRSSRLFERSRGHIDVGAASSYLILESFYNSIKDLKE
ncbi:MAG: dihydroxyacetone kinase subunit L [Actinobacteria bacterium]|nr:dihydroxyacetone kinase subunit L [Actinomycetota bacterium]